jgi:amino acid permease
MIGTGILVYPLLYKNNGMIMSQIIVTLIGLISYKTAELCIIHTKSDEDDLTKVVKRQLGNTWHKVYCITGGMYLALTGGVYYLLILNTLYSQINFLYTRTTGNHLISKDILTFKEFSF